MQISVPRQRGLKLLRVSMRVWQRFTIILTVGIVTCLTGLLLAATPVQLAGEQVFRTVAAIPSADVIPFLVGGIVTLCLGIAGIGLLFLRRHVARRRDWEAQSIETASRRFHHFVELGPADDGSTQTYWDGT